MEENIADTLLTASGVMHFFGQYRVATALVCCARLCRIHDVHTLDDLQRHTEFEQDCVAQREGSPTSGEGEKP